MGTGTAAMAMSSSSSSSSAAAAAAASSRLRIRRDEVYVAAVALRATKGAPQLLMSAAYNLNFWDLQHFMVIIKHTSNNPPPHQVMVCDFQPKNPENIWVAASALSGRHVPGVVLVRKLAQLPKRKCWFVGYSNENTIDVATHFNKNWDTNLKIGHHDCRHYCQGLVECLTCNKIVLEELKDGRSTQG